MAIAIRSRKVSPRPAAAQIYPAPVRARTGAPTTTDRRKNQPISGPSKAAINKPDPLEDYLSLQGRFKGIDPKTVEFLKQRIVENHRRLAVEEAVP